MPSADTPHRKAVILALICAVFLAIVDQAVKLGLLYIYDIAFQPKLYLLPFLDLVLVWNKGISFGMLSHDDSKTQILLIGIAIIAFAFLIYWLKDVRTYWGGLAIGCIMGGAMGNIIDRIAHGAVVDFLHLHWNNDTKFIFNTADAFITIGVILLLLDSMLQHKRN
ncbi:MAG: signal peptidase II [Cohaesibacteraceae bacterium]|nr:signal peptidase II [Cohaesibacteraceae bacterium]